MPDASSTSISFTPNSGFTGTIFQKSEGHLPELRNLFEKFLVLPRVVEGLP